MELSVFQLVAVTSCHRAPLKKACPHALDAEQAALGCCGLFLSEHSQNPPGCAPMWSCIGDPALQGIWTG